jgi:hypothetical protein
LGGLFVTGEALVVPLIRERLLTPALSSFLGRRGRRGLGFHVRFGGGSCGKATKCRRSLGLVWGEGLLGFYFVGIFFDSLFVFVD